ncbi:hypothetical protein, partial [Mycobacterium palustre]|uniref:hypothetical protein n=1 Tax=Mycobacterium palustre TaxID=153971 RepID=UPI0035579285
GAGASVTGACVAAGGAAVVGVSVGAGGLVSPGDGGGCGVVDGAGAGEVGVLVTGGVLAGLSSPPNAIANAVPTSASATTVLMMITPGSRYHGMTGFLGSGAGRSGWSNLIAGRAEV